MADWMRMGMFVFGVIAGAGAHAAGVRVPAGRPLFRWPWGCLSCGKPFAAAEALPVSFRFVGGCRCRYCGVPHVPGRPFTEAATGLLFLAVYEVYGNSLETAMGALFVTLLAAVSVADAAFRLIPNRVLYPFFWLFLAMRAWNPLEPSFLSHLGGMAAAFLCFWLLSLLSQGGVGGGDIKLYGVVGLFLGLPLVSAAVLFASLLGAAYGLAQLVRGRAGGKTAIPFAPFIASGAVAAYLANPFLFGG